MIGKIAKKSKNVSERLSILFLENMGGATARFHLIFDNRKATL